MLLETIRKELFTLFHTPTTSDLLLNPLSPVFIPSNSSVLVVGPGIDDVEKGRPTPMDRTPLLLAPYLAKGGGRMTIVDIPDDPAGPSTADYGNHSLSRIREYFSLLQKLLPICPIDYVESYILKDNLQEKFDVIVDHLTTYGWIAGYIQYIPENAYAMARKFYDLLNNAGKLVLHRESLISLDDKERFRGITNSLRAVGFTISLINRMRDLYVIDPRIMADLEKSDHRFLFISNGKMHPTYQSDGIILGVKR